MLQVSTTSAECSTTSSRADQVRVKQQLVTEAGQRGCWDTQRPNRQPAWHPLFSALLILDTSLQIYRSCLLKNTARTGVHITTTKEQSNWWMFRTNKWTIAGRVSFPSFHLSSWIVLLYTYRWCITFCCWAANKVAKEKEGYLALIIPSMYFTHHLMSWTGGVAVGRDSLSQLSKMNWTISLASPPVMCTKSPSASNSLLGLHWSRDEVPLKQHNSSHCVSTRTHIRILRKGRGLWRGEGGVLRAHSHNYNN